MAGDSSSALFIRWLEIPPALCLSDDWRFIRAFINYPMAGDFSGALLIIRGLEIPPALYYLSEGWRFLRHFINYPTVGYSSSALLIIRYIQGVTSRKSVSCMFQVQKSSQGSFIFLDLMANSAISHRNKIRKNIRAGDSEFGPQSKIFWGASERGPIG